MNLRDVNRQALRRFHPEIAQKLDALSPGPERGTWTLARNGLPTVRRDGVALVSAFDPPGEALRAVPEWDDPDFLVLTGLGAGYLAEAVVARYPDVPVLLVEEDPRWWAEVLEHRDLSQLWAHPQLIPLLGPEASLVSDTLKPLACRRVEVLDWRPEVRGHPEWSLAVRAQVAQAQATAGVNQATYQRFKTLWRRNLVKNEASGAAVRAVEVLRGLGAGKPAVVVAAGPSLAEALPWIQARREGFLLIAVDTAWPALAAHGVAPDFLMIMDGQYWNGRHVDQVPPSTTWVVTEWIGPPRAFRLAPGRTFVAASSVPFLRAREERLWGPLGSLPSGGSVATAAWSLALHLGCSPVAFAGLDLGYPRGQTHVPGSQFEEAVHRNAHRLRPAETSGWGLSGVGLTRRPALDGGTVLSDPRMDLFRDWLEASVATHPAVSVVNLSTRGSVIRGLGPATQDYGANWMALGRLVPPPGPFLRRRDDLGSTPLKWNAPPDSSAERNPWLTAIAQAVSERWGASVWESWTARERRTWERWPSARSWRRLVETIELIREWDDFASPGE